MNRWAFLLIVFLLQGVAAQAQSGYNIQVQLKPYTKGFLYLAYHYGDKKALADSAALNEQSVAVFKGTKKLPGGIYIITSPKKEILFELLIDQSQQFQVKADTATLAKGITFIGSPENTRFQQYIKKANYTGVTAAQLNEALKNAASVKDSLALRSKLQKLGTDLQNYRDSIQQHLPQTLMAALFRAMREPVVPEASKHPQGHYDTLYAFNYFKKHYWDGVAFDDERLIRTPFFEAKLNRYYKDLVPPVVDSIIPEVDHMLLYARPSDEMFKYLMVYFVQKYVNPEYMGMDEVFVHLFEKYINTGQTPFFTEQYKEFVTKRAYSLMANLIGRPAYDLEMVDRNGTPTTLYNVKAPLTVVCFWDPTCGHCKESVPRLDSIYQAKWKSKGIKMYGVMTDGGKDNWIKFIEEKHLNDWIHVYQLPEVEERIKNAQKPSYRQLYDVYQTPVIYLLDADKKIIAKKLAIEQLDEVITLKLKNKTP